MENLDIQKYINFNKMDLSLGNYFIQLNTNLPQQFTTRFKDGRVFTVFIHYNRAFANWFMDIYLQGENGNLEPQALNIMLEWGLDLLLPYKYKDLGEFYVYSKNAKEFDSPTFNDLTNNFIYLWRHS